MRRPECRQQQPSRRSPRWWLQRLHSQRGPMQPDAYPHLQCGVDVVSCNRKTGYVCIYQRGRWCPGKERALNVIAHRHTYTAYTSCPMWWHLVSAWTMDASVSREVNRDLYICKEKGCYNSYFDEKLSMMTNSNVRMWTEYRINFIIHATLRKKGWMSEILYILFIISPLRRIMQIFIIHFSLSS